MQDLQQNINHSEEGHVFLNKITSIPFYVAFRCLLHINGWQIVTNVSFFWSFINILKNVIPESQNFKLKLDQFENVTTPDTVSTLSVDLSALCLSASGMMR